MDVAPRPSDLAALLVFFGVFSFLYTVVPLAFWGHTPGMAWAGLRAEDAAGGPLPFGGTVRRWLAAVVTLAGAGVPLLVALSGRSLADRVSGSRTYAAGSPAELASRRAR
jgi:uncharacterized RDD family membrane protein YckC